MHIRLRDPLTIISRLTFHHCCFIHSLQPAVHNPKSVFIPQKCFMKTLTVCQEINSQEQAEVPMQVLMNAWLPHISVNKSLTALGKPPKLGTKHPQRRML